MAPDADDLGMDAAVVNRIGRLLSELEDADFERVDPPAEIWERIEASVTSDGAAAPQEPHRLPKQPPSGETSAGVVVEYWIDADDVVSGVGPGWADFARDNAAPELANPAPDGTLWAYFDSDETRDLWRLLIQRTRTTQTAARVPLRCDAPHTRRWFDMTITPAADGTVHFSSALVFEESRPSIALLDPHSQRDIEARPVPLCSWCGRAQHEDAWLDVEDLVRAGRLLERTSMPPISYGICEVCRDEMSAELLVPGTVIEPPA